MFIVIYIFIKFLSHKVEMSSRSQIKVYQCYLNRTCIRQGQAQEWCGRGQVGRHARLQGQ